MIRIPSFPLLLALAFPLAAAAQLELIPGESGVEVFSGTNRAVVVLLKNPTAKTVEEPVRARIFQAASDTTMPVTNLSWKTLTVRAGQTVMETARLDFPVVRSATRFVVRWEGAEGRKVGVTEVLVHPPHPLSELKPMLAGKVLGVFDPDGELKPVLQSAGVPFEDLENSELRGFEGGLALIRPAAEPTKRRSGFSAEVTALVKAGLAVVWIETAPELLRSSVEPRVVFQHFGEGAMVISRARSISTFRDNAAGQVNLTRLCRVALGREPLGLPEKE